MKLLQASFFAASELTLLSRQAGELYFDIAWIAREEERRQTLPEDQTIDVSLGNWPYAPSQGALPWKAKKPKETATKTNVVPIRKGK